MPPLGASAPLGRQADQADVDVLAGRPGRSGPKSAAPLPDPGLQRLKADLERRVAQVASELRQLGEPGRLAAQRITQVLADSTSYTPSAAYATINPIESADAIERSYFARAHWLTFIRNALVLLPLLLTWIALGLASWAYQQELARSPLDVNHPLLELWQRGFTLHGPAGAFSISSFSTVAAVDAGLFFLLILVGGIADAVAMRARTAARTAQRSLEDVTMQICHYCAEARVSESGFPDMQRWTDEIRQTIHAAAAATQHASDSLRDMSSLAAQFQTNVDRLSTSAQTVSTSAGGLSGAVAGVSTSASDMKKAAESAAAEQKRSADALNAVLLRMDEFARSSAGSASEVRKMSDEIIKGFKESNSAMRDAAKTVEDAGKTMQNAAERLGGRLPTEDNEKCGLFRRLFGGGKRAKQKPSSDRRAPTNSYPNRYPADPYDAYPPQSAAHAYTPDAAYSAPQATWTDPYPSPPPAVPPAHESSDQPIYLHGQSEPSDGSEPFRRN